MNNYIILDGFALARQKNQQLKKVLLNCPSLSLATILVGDDKASNIYVQAKHKACCEVGIKPIPIFLPENTTEQELLQKIQELNEEPSIHGILVQLPLPKHINSALVLESINPKKDVDCFHPYNVGNLSTGISDFAPATPLGIMMLLESIQDQWSLKSKSALIVGTSNIVGKPTAMLLLQKQATITMAHSHTKNLKELCLQAELIVSAVGKANLITKDMVKQGAVIIDVGMNRIQTANGYRLVGDVDFDQVKDKAFAITPVPKGVGPMTICALLYNLHYLYKTYY